MLKCEQIIQSRPMNPLPIETRNLRLVPLSREDARARVAGMNPQARAQVSPAWLALVETSGPLDPWIHGFIMTSPDQTVVIGQCGFKGPPDAEGAVEIAYGVDPFYQGRGYATEAAEALTDYAFRSGLVSVVRAHTLPEPNASGRVLTKCGFVRVGEVIDPEDGLVWRWEKRKPAS
jgi:[ribosomal protein S5]-alanine N-acetyltransferase